MKYTNIMQSSSQSDREIINESVFSVAARAAAIYLCNKQKQLPPVYFHIIVNKLADVNIENPDSNYFIKLEGGQLIHNVLLFSKENTRIFSGVQRLTYELALEADIVNLLVGPLAKGKYKSVRDRTSFNRDFFCQHSLSLYGGAKDLEHINEYLDCYSGQDAAKRKTINDLFRKSWDFINQPANWLAISELANYILGNDKDIIECNEIINVLQTFIPAAGANISNETRQLQLA